MHGLFRGVSCAAITVLAGALMVGVPVAGADELGGITGTVSTEGSAAAAAAAEVTLYDSSDVLVRTVAADASGGYTVPGLAPGSYRLHFAAGGANAAHYLPEWWDNAAQRDAAQAVTVLASETVTLGDAQLSAAPRSPAPVISGSATVGQTLTGITGDWSPTPDSFGYQWYTDAGTAPAPITGATAVSYLVTPADLGNHLSLEVTANRAGADPLVERSTATAAVAAGQFRTAPTPTLSGTAAVGQTLRATAGTWSPTATLSYQWFRGSAAIAGARASTYLLAAADGATHVSVRVTGTASGYVPTTRTSAQTGWVQRLLTRGTPRVTGTAKYGQVLTASPGTWGPSGVTLRYQWYLATAPIAGATTSSYRPGVGTIGKQVHVTVTGSKSGYLSATQTSAAVKVAAASFTSVPTRRSPEPPRSAWC